MRPLGSPRPGGAGVPRGSAIKGPGTAVPGVAVAVTAAGGVTVEGLGVAFGDSSALPPQATPRDRARQTQAAAVALIDTPLTMYTPYLMSLSYVRNDVAS